MSYDIKGTWYDIKGTRYDIKGADMILKVHDMILKVRCDDIKLGNAICGGNWQPLNIIFFGETFVKNIIVYLILV